MKHRVFGLVFMILFALVPLTAWTEEANRPYLYEQLNKPVYNKTFNALFKGQHQLEPWLKEYLKSRDGVDTPGEMRTVGGKSYEFYEICEPHNCPGNGIYVFFEQGGAHAWVLFTRDDGISRFFGHPDIEMQAALKSAVH